MEKKNIVIDGIIGSTVISFLLVIAAIAVSSVTASNFDCVDIDCLRQRLERTCKDGTAPSYLDCENLLRCIGAGEQEIMRECARGYQLAEN